MPKVESLRPVGVMFSTLSLQLRDTGSNTAGPFSQYLGLLRPPNRLWIRP